MNIQTLVEKCAKYRVYSMCVNIYATASTTNLGFVPIWVEVIGQWGSDHTASIPLVIEEGKDVSFVSTLGQNFPRGSGNLQLLASLGLIASHDLVEGLDDYE